MAISASQVKELREASGAGVLECRKVLEETGGNMEKALAILRERGMAAAAKRANREAREGMIEVYSHGGGRVGVMVEVNCETDFVARTEQFRTFVHNMALQIAAESACYVDTTDIPSEIVEEEKRAARTLALAEGKPEDVLDKIVAGRLEKFYQEVCLVRQPFIKDETIAVGDLLKQTIAATGENIVIRRFVRWERGGN